MEHQWYEEAIIYHLYSLSLAGSASAPYSENDYSAVEHKLGEIEKWIPHIKGMGFNAVLLSPVLKSRLHGYDVSDYFQIDNRLGTNEEFQSLVRVFHENGIRVILDSVFNHCGRDFFAFAELRNNNRAYANWFSGVDFNRQSPMGDHFTYDTWDGHFNLPKFNLHNDAVRNYLFDAARFWIDFFDIDGMRLDCANVLDFGFMSDLRRITGEKKNDFWLMGEVVHGDYSRWVNPSVLHSVTNYTLYKSLYSSHNDNNLYELSYCVRNAISHNGLPLYTFLDNHDQPRIASLVSKPEFLSTLYTLLFTLPGVPSLYYGSEWGLQANRENGADLNIRPYINIDDRAHYSTWLTGHISKLAHIRRQQKALIFGDYRQIYWEYKRPFVFERTWENERIFIAINIADHKEIIRLNNHISGPVQDLLSGERIGSTHAINLLPHSARILAPLK